VMCAVRANGKARLAGPTSLETDAWHAVPTTSRPTSAVVPTPPPGPYADATSDSHISSVPGAFGCRQRTPRHIVRGDLDRLSEPEAHAWSGVVHPADEQPTICRDDVLAAAGEGAK
jgi:hypothetical protein